MSKGYNLIMTRQEQVNRFVAAIGAVKRNLTSSHGQQIGVSRAQAEMLFMIKLHKLNSVGELATALEITSGAVTQVIEGLVQDGLLARVRDEQDRRIVHIEFTAEGESKFRELRRHHLSNITRLLEPLTDGEIAALAELLDKVTAQRPVSASSHE